MSMIGLIPLEGTFTIYQPKTGQKIPEPILNASFCSVTKTSEEVSVVTNCETLFEELKSNNGWRGFKVDGILDFSLVGIINEITKPLKENNISVFVVSTFNTDYLFVKTELSQKAIEAFEATGLISVKK